jgi:hypothetical protein
MQWEGYDNWRGGRCGWVEDVFSLSNVRPDEGYGIDCSPLAP